MFRKRDPQCDLFESSSLIPPAKAKLLRKSWAHTFRTKALSLIDEEVFSPLYCEDNGRPNKPVEVVFGVLILKEMFDLTDDEALEHLEFNLQWHHALRLKPEEAHLCQKTLHNFRTGIMRHKLGRVAFEETTGRIIEALGVKVTRQRLDSTHIISNIAILTRLGLFCETIRVFLSRLRVDHSRLYKRVPEGLRSRYLRDDGEETRYHDARSGEARRRLSVCARDLYRLVDRFRGTAAAGLKEYGLLERLLEEQCEIAKNEERPRDDDDDSGEGQVPVKLKEAKEVGSDSMQSPHDPDVTYSGHKGKGYEAQVTETCDEENEVEIITQVEVTDSCDGDAGATIPMIEGLAERGIQPEELEADTAYGSAQNAVKAKSMGTELVSPVAGGAMEENREKDELLKAADFDIDPAYGRPTICPAGHESVREQSDHDAYQKVKIVFDRAICEECPEFCRCPAKLNREGNGYVLKANLFKVNIECRRRAERSGEFAGRYNIRAGIEATNSELKRKHGMGRLRVRGRPRVELAVFLKVLACNIKRMVRTLVARAFDPEPAIA
jgi:hypothetical protein